MCRRSRPPRLCSRPSLRSHAAAPLPAAPRGRCAAGASGAAQDRSAAALGAADHCSAASRSGHCQPSAGGRGCGQASGRRSCRHAPGCCGGAASGRRCSQAARGSGCARREAAQSKPAGMRLLAGCCSARQRRSCDRSSRRAPQPRGSRSRGGGAQRRFPPSPPNRRPLRRNSRQGRVPPAPPARRMVMPQTGPRPVYKASIVAPAASGSWSRGGIQRGKPIFDRRPASGPAGPGQRGPGGPALPANLPEARGPSIPRALPRRIRARRTGSSRRTARFWRAPRIWRTPRLWRTARPGRRTADRRRRRARSAQLRAAAAEASSSIPRPKKAR